jgi:3-oxoacyl-[acyl-carrier protein] reductase
MSKRLDQKVAIITGASKGIGKGIAKVFAREGAKLLLVARSESDLQKTAAEIRDGGAAEISFMCADISQAADMRKMADTALTKFGRVDILCQNAGIFPSTRIDDMSESEWDQVHATNLKGTFLAIKACLPAMEKQKYGRIVITSSITGPRTGQPGLAHYAATKAGINGFIKTAAIELARYNITVNAIEPGNILTEGMEGLGAQYIRDQELSIPLGKLGTPEDCGHAVLFLASDEAQYITGQTIIVDGGQTLPESRFAVS